MHDLLSLIRLAALEALAKVNEHETLRDLFWTLYFKLDAALQGFRVTYEIANPIGQVSTHVIYMKMPTNSRGFNSDKCVATRIQRFIWCKTHISLPIGRHLDADPN